MNRYDRPKSVLQVGQQVEHLRLDGHVQGRDGLVADDQPGPQRERPGTPMRWRWPPEKLGGVPVVVLGVEADPLHELLHGRLRWLPVAVLCTANGSPMIDPTRRRGLSDPYGSWKIIWICRR